MTIFSGLSIAVGGLANIDRQLALLSHNVSNASTPDYVRETAVQTALTADGVGMGVRSGVATRAVDVPLQGALWSQEAQVADLTTRQSALGAIDAVQGAPGAGTDLASLLGAMRDAFSSLGNNPADAASQQAVVQSAQTLARAINTLGATYGTQRQSAQDSIQSDIGTLNQTLAQVGDLSTQIIRMKSMGQSTADFENQRDAAIRQIAQLVDVRSVAQANGDVTLISASGMTLPVHGGGAAFSMASATMGAGAYYPGGGVPGIMLGGQDVTAQFNTGRIGANIALRDRVLPSYQAGLDEFAQTLANRFDAQGLSLFTDPTGTIPSAGGTPVQSGYVGFSLSIVVNPTVIADPTTVRDGTHVVTGSATGAAAFTPNPTGGPAGFTDMIQRVLDYTLGTQAQSGVTQPPPNISGLGPGGNLSLAYGAPASLADFATNLTASQSGDSAATKTRLQTEQTLQTTLQGKYDTATAVNVDAEMALMIQLQNAYGANARVISTSQAMWDQLLGAVK